MHVAGEYANCVREVLGDRCVFNTYYVGVTVATRVSSTPGNKGPHHDGER